MLRALLRRAVRTGGLWAALVSFAWGARAEPLPSPELPQTLTLTDALELLRTRSPRTQAEQARLEVAAAARLESSVYPNPSLSYGALLLARGVNTGARRQHEIVVEQPLLLFGQRGARGRVAELSVRAERARVEASLAERELAVRQAFAALLSRQERVRILDEAAAELERLERIVLARHQAGDRSRYDVARIELEARSLEMELRAATAEVEAASRSLAALLGFPDFRPRAQGELAPRALPTSPERLWQLARERNAAIAVARADEALARGGLALSRRERMPVPAIALGTLLTEDENSASAFVGVSLPLPLFDRGQGAVARAKAELTVAERTLRAELEEARAEIARLAAAYAHRVEILRTLEQRVSVHVPELRRMAEDSYREGNTGILELLDSVRTVVEVRLQHLEHRELVRQAEAALIVATALEPQP